MEDEEGTVKLVAEMGYQIVEFWAPYFNWSAAEARSMRDLMEDLGIECRSTHNGANYFDEENLDKTIELNQILGSKNLIMASAGRVQGADGWRALAEKMTGVSERLTKLGMATGFHNHQFEWRALPDAGGQRIMDILAKNTPKEFVLQLDVGTCVEAGADPVAWIKANPGRIKSVHCKDWGAGDGPNRGYRVLFGEGDAPWKEIFAAAESVGGVEYYLIEQEGSRYDSLETARLCLENYRELRA